MALEARQRSIPDRPWHLTAPRFAANGGNDLHHRETSDQDYRLGVRANRLHPLAPHLGRVSFDKGTPVEEVPGHHPARRSRMMSSDRGTPSTFAGRYFSR